MSDNSKGFLISIAPNPINQAEKWKMTAGYFANFGQNELPVGIFHCKKKKILQNFLFKCKTNAHVFEHYIQTTFLTKSEMLYTIRA